MRRAALALIVLAIAVPASAQPALPTCKAPATAPAQVMTRTYQEYWCEQVLRIYALHHPADGTGLKAGDRREIFQAVTVLGPNWGAFLLYAQARSGAVDASAIEEARTDKQVGAPAAAAGSTSLVSKGSVPGILGFAVENGALTQSATGTTVTVRGNLVGWLDLLKNQDFILSYQDGSPLVRQLRRISYSLTLNTDTGATAAASSGSGSVPLTPEAIRDQLNKTKQQLAGYSVRVAIVDRRDPRTAANRASIATLADTKLAAALQADNAFSDFLASGEYTQTWLNGTVDVLADPDRPLTVAQIQRVLYQRLEALRLLMINRVDDFDDKVATNLLALQAYDKARRRIFDALSKRPLFAFEFVKARSKELPDSSTLRFIAEGQWGSRVDLTANAALTLQNSGTVNATDVSGRRDFQAAAQIDMPLGSLQKRLSVGGGISAPVLAFALLSQKLTDKAAVSFAGRQFTVEPGWVNAVQAKLTFSVKGSGVKVPLSLTYANRTELLKEKDVRGHIGVTFDMDVLSSLVRP